MATDITGHKILMEKQHINYALYNVLKDKNELVDKMNPTSDAKAVKNEVEIENEKRAHIKDGVAVTRFIYWLKHHIGKERLTELGVQDKLEEFRKEQEAILSQALLRSLLMGRMRLCVTILQQRKVIRYWKIMILSGRFRWPVL